MDKAEVESIVRAMKFRARAADGTAYAAVADLERWFGAVDEHRKDDDKHSAADGGYTDADAVKAVKDAL
ncbi:MAG: hypothetical protein V3U27_21450 [Candidatus Tectomicrobia bacterium]